MKILHVITSLQPGGAERLMVDILPRLKELGNMVELAIFNSERTIFYDQLERAGIKIHGFSNSKDVYNIKHLFYLFKLMKNFDIVHTHNTACQFFAAIVRTKSIKLLTTEHSTSTRRRKFKFFRYIDGWMYSRYDKIVCISEPAEESLCNYIGSHYPTVTIHNGIDVARFVNAQKVDLGLSDFKLITMVAGFRYEKDQPTLIKSLIYLPKDYHLLLVGDGVRRKELETLISDLSLNDRVHFLGIRNDVPQILKSSDIIVMSSHREGLSLSNVEGMSSGNPFIASDVEGLREITEGYGVLFPQGDDRALANCILELCEDENKRSEVTLKCIKRAMQYDISFMVQKYNDLYIKLFNEK